MPKLNPTSPSRPFAPKQNNRRLWFAYAGIWVLIWALFLLAAMQSDVQRGEWRPWQAIYQATWTLWPAMLFGVGIYFWVNASVTSALKRDQQLLIALGVHVAGAILFSFCWQAASYVAGWALYGLEFAQASLDQTILWRLIQGVFVYGALAAGFIAVLNARSARANSVAAANADALRVRAELAAVTGKLNPHFLFNTLNSLIALTRKDAKAAEQSLLRFSGMLRYVLDKKRGSSNRVTVREELDFVRDYLSLEQLRLGHRLSVNWQIDEAALDEEIPPLSIQPLVENSIIHGIAPQISGGTVTIVAQYVGARQSLRLSVSDNGAGLQAKPSSGSGIGVSALRQRFALDFDGRATFDVATNKAAGVSYSTEMIIPL